jgi:hypothetical protein
MKSCGLLTTLALRLLFSTTDESTSITNKFELGHGGRKENVDERRCTFEEAR